MSFDCPAWPPDWPEIDEAIRRLLRGGDWGRYHAEACRDLLARMVDFTGVFQARLCCSGTAAMEIALRAAQVGPGDGVILAAYDFPGNFRTVELLGARPVLVDLSSESLGVDPEQLQQLSSEPGRERIRAVIASHLYGTAAEIERIRQICETRQWVLIEDACQVAGMTIGGRPVGTLGHLATLSFGGSKPISAGGGGAILANDPRLAARLGGLMDRPGEVYPLSPLQAAVIGPQLDRLEELNQQRRATVRFLEQELIERLEGWTWLSRTRPNVSSAYYKVAWLASSAEHRDRIVAASEQENLPMGTGYRSASRTSDRRCDKPFPTPRSESLAERLFVLDHRALMLPPSRYGDLTQSLLRVVEATR